MKKDEAKQVLDALKTGLNYASGGSAWTPEADVQELTKAIAIMRREVEPPTIKESLKVHASAEDYLRYKYGAYRGHFAWRELEEAYSQGRYDEGMAQGPYPWPDDPLDLELRGLLASKLKCWHRLSGAESTELVALFESLRPQAVEPISDAECADWKKRNYALIDEAVILKVRIDELLEANSALVSALDRILDVLRGAYVDDVALIVNKALDKNRKTE